MQTKGIKTKTQPANLQRDLGYKPDTPVNEGIEHFVEWYRGYFKT